MSLLWKQFGIQAIAVHPKRYTSGLQEQIGRKLTARRLAQALSEDSHKRVSVATAGKVLKKYPPLKDYDPIKHAKRWKDIAKSKKK